MIVNRKSIAYLRLFSDLILLNMAFILATILAQSFDLLIDRDRMFILEAALNFAWYFFANTTNIYDDFVRRLFVFQIVSIIKNILVQVLVSIIFIFLVKEDLFTRNFIVYYAVLLFAFVTLRQIVFRKVLKKLRKRGINIRNLLIIGTGEIAKNFKKLISENPDFGYKFSGFLDSKSANNNENVIGEYEQLEKILSTENINEVVIALPQKDNPLMNGFINICDRYAVRTHIIPDYFKFISQRFHISMIGNFPIITSRVQPLDEIQWRAIKRIFDIIFSFLMIVLVLSWLLPLIFIAVKIVSPGPVFFSQERIGTGHKKFKCYKIRTMHKSDKKSEVHFKPVVENDPRVTKIGGFLRKSNFDELPQFINVFKGDMSVVGPRPHAIHYDEVYGKIVDEIRLRYNVKPGITGWAQIHGLRGDVPDKEENIRRARKRIEFDIWYVENWSMTFDLQIILITIWQMLRGKSKGL